MQKYHPGSSLYEPGGQFKQFGLKVKVPGGQGALLGDVLGSSLGSTVGEELGYPVGELLGETGDTVLGDKLGFKLGTELGFELGLPEGDSLGSTLDEELGYPVGDLLGDTLGSSLEISWEGRTFDNETSDVGDIVGVSYAGVLELWRALTPTTAPTTEPTMMSMMKQPIMIILRGKEVETLVFSGEVKVRKNSKRQRVDKSNKTDYRKENRIRHKTILSNNDTNLVRRYQFLVYRQLLNEWI